MRHFYCALRNWLYALLLDPCWCDKCVTNREIAEQAEDLADAAEAWANGESS